MSLLNNILPKNICFSDDVSSKIGSLIKWQDAYISPKLEFRIGEYGIGAFSKEKIENEEILLLIETKDMITVEKALKVVGFKKSQKSPKVKKKITKN